MIDKSRNQSFGLETASRPQTSPASAGLVLGLVLAEALVLSTSWTLLDARPDLEINTAGVLVAVNMLDGQARISLEVTTSQAEGWSLTPGHQHRWLCWNCR
jgi:hypothetical protein